MATASYQSNNDYNLVKEIRPFDLPYQATMQEIATKTSYWKVGADKVKSIYDQAVGLDPQFSQNKEYLKNFMDQANKNLQKITKSDLSNLDNSGEAVNIFKPLYDTTNKFNYRLLKDSQINKHYQKQQSLSDMYRTKDGGKEWSADNDFYFRDAQQKYATDAQNGNLDSIDNHFQNRKDYIPYYGGVQKEMLEIQEACKGASFKNRDVSKNEMYFQETSKKGCTPEELSLALKSGLSGQARKQLEITGYAKFKGNEDELAKQFTDIYVNKKKEKLDNILATLQGIKSGGISKDEMPRYVELQNIYNELGNEYKDSKLEYDKMTGGNVTEYVKQNYDKLAGQVYFGQIVEQAGQAFRTDDSQALVTSNPVGMLKYRSEVDRTNMYIQDDLDKKSDYLNHMYRKDENIQKGEIDKELARLRGDLKSQKDGSGADNPMAAQPVTMDNQNPIEVTESNYINDNLKPTVKKLDDAYSVISDYVTKGIGQTTGGSTHKQIENYITEIKKKKDKGQSISQNDKDALSAYEDYKKAKSDLAFYNDKIESVNNQIKNTNKELFDDTKYSANKLNVTSFEVINTFKTKDNFLVEKNQKFSSNFKLSEKDFFSLFNGKNVNGFTIESKPEYFYDSDGEGKVQHLEPKIEKRLYFNGQLVDISSNSSLKNLFNSTNKKGEDNFRELEKLKTQAYTKNYYENSPFTVFRRSDFGKEKDWKDNYDQTFSSALGVPGGLGEKDGYEIAFRDRTGEGAWVRILDSKAFPKDISGKGGDDILARLKNGAYGSGVKKEKIQGGYAYYIPNVFSGYANLPSNEGLEEMNKLKEHMSDILTNLTSNPQMINKPVFDSRSMPTGGTSLYTGKSGIDYLIHIIVEKGKSPKYRAMYHDTDGAELFYEASTMDSLSTQLY